MPDEEEGLSGNDNVAGSSATNHNSSKKPSYKKTTIQSSAKPILQQNSTSKSSKIVPSSKNTEKHILPGIKPIFTNQ